MKTYRASILFLSFIFAGVSIANIGVAQAAMNPQCVVITRNMSVGSTDRKTGNSVTVLQNFLHTEGFFPNAPTGYFGRVTSAAVKNFQAQEKLPKLGIVGPLTRAAIIRVSCAGGKTPSVQAPTERVLPYKTDTFTDWVGTWGGVKQGVSKGLFLNAETTTNGAEAFFPASRNWKDYEYSADVVVSNGSITLLARSIDPNNFIGCSFAADSIQVRERANGVTTTVAEGKVVGRDPYNFFNTSTSVSMRVKGDTVTCRSLGAEENLKYTISTPDLYIGGIGIQTWQSGVGSASLELRDVKVEAI